jgi:ribose transport system ATP-binding protein
MTDAPATAPLLEVRSVSKRFPGVRALREVSLSLGKGEVVALIGENGAGKSTLMKILAGVQKPDEGEIRIDGQPIAFDGVDDSLAAGVSLIHQELNLSDNLDVGANIFLGREPRRFGLIDKAKIHRDSKKYLEAVGLDVSPRTIVGTLPIGRQQLVEIAKALSTNARVLIMDEPTSSLTQHETESLFRVVKELRGRGVSVIYISHRLGEVKELADRVVVLRDGQNAGELPRDAICHDAMVRMMVGRDISQYHSRKAHEAGETVLTVKNLRTPAHPRQGLNFSVRRAEIVGVAGLVGAGRTEMLTTLFGITPPVGGTIEVAGRASEVRSPLDAIAAGLALVPEDRKLQGLVLEMGVKINLSLASLRRDQKRGFLNRAAEKSISDRMIAAMRVKTPNDRQPVQYLSGGNQQKVVLGKWLAMEPRLLLLDEPTRGIDVGAKEEIYKLLHDLASRGMAILFVSSEMEEVISLADRVLVMHEGRLTGELRKGDLSEESIMRLATGAVPELV